MMYDVKAEHIARHGQHIAKGFCKAGDYRTWCNGIAGHLDEHWAPYIKPDGGTDIYKWTVDTGCPCEEAS